MLSDRFLGGIDLVDRVSADTASTVDLAVTSGISLASEQRPYRSEWAAAVRRWPILASVAAVAIVALMISFTWRSPADPVSARKDRIVFAIPEKTSIAVAPFANVSANSDIDIATSSII